MIPEVPGKKIFFSEKILLKQGEKFFIPDPWWHVK